jgi:hypothetical protein
MHWPQLPAKAAEDSRTARRHKEDLAEYKSVVFGKQIARAGRISISVYK